MSSNEPRDAHEPDTVGIDDTDNTDNTDDTIEGPDAFVMQIHMDRSESVLAEHRSHARVDDFHRAFEAERIDDGTFTPVSVVDGFTVGGQPILQFTDHHDRIVVDAAMMSSLTTVDVTSLARGARIHVGTLTRDGMSGIQPRRLVEFLIRADVLRTYCHMESCTYLRSDSHREDGEYRAQLDGTHTYFTNKENCEQFAFELRLSPAGVIEVIGC